MEDKEREILRRFIPHSVYNRITYSPEMLNGFFENKVITAVFVNIIKSLNLTEPENLEAIATALNDFFAEASKIILKYGGEIHTFGEDGILAVFGADVYYNAQMASLCAIELLRVQMDKEILNFSIGIATGNASFIVVDGASSAFTWLGKPVKLARELAAKAEVGKILLEEETLRNIEHYFKIQNKYIDEAGPYNNVYELTEERKLSPPMYKYPLFGRERELSLIKRFVKTFFLEEKCAAMGISGLGGIGKTRLGKEAIRYFSEKGGNTIFYECENKEKSPPFAPFFVILKDYFNVNNAKDLMQYTDKESAELFFSILKRQQRNMPLNVREVLFNTMVKLLSAKEPVLIYISGADKLDSLSADFIRYILHRDVPVILFLDARDERIFELLNIQYLKLYALNARESRRLTAAIFEGKRMRSNLPTVLHEKYGGNPVLIEESAKTLRNKKLVFENPDAVYPSPKFSNFKLPDSMERLEQLLLETLSEKHREMLKLSSCIACHISRDMLKKLGFGDEDIDEMLYETSIKSVVIPTAAGFSFPSPSVKEAVESLLSAGERKNIHRTIGYILEKQPLDNWNSIAYHFKISGDGAKAFDYYIKAGEDAFLLTAFDDAVWDFEQAISLVKDKESQLDLLLRIAKVQDRKQDSERALKYLKDAMSICKKIKNNNKLALVLKSLAEANLKQGNAGSALINLKEAKKLAEKTGNKSLLFQIYEVYFDLYFYKGDHKHAEGVLNEMLEISDTSDTDDFKLIALLASGRLNYTMNNLEKSRSSLEQALSISERLAEIQRRGDIFFNLGLISMKLRDYGNAEKMFKEASRLYRITGNKNGLFKSMDRLAEIEFELGHVDNAITLEQNILAALPDNTREELFFKVSINLADYFAYKGYYKKSMEVLQDMLKYDDSSKYNDEIFARLSRYNLRTGNYSRALQYIKDVKHSKLLMVEFYLLMDNVEKASEFFGDVAELPHYHKCLLHLAGNKEVKLDFSGEYVYDYVEEEWVCKSVVMLEDLKMGNFAAVIKEVDKIKNLYFNALLKLNLAKFIMDQGGTDDTNLIDEVKKISEAQGYRELLMWVMCMEGRKEETDALIDSMFYNSDSLKDDYINRRKSIFNKYC